MNIIEIYGTANDFSGGFDDDGNHHGYKLSPCPFCGKDDTLEICNTHTPIFWIECGCGAEKHGEYIDGAGNTSTKIEALTNYTKALVSAVNAWNSRPPVQSVVSVTDAETVSFDTLNAVVAEVTGGNQHAWNGNIYKGHQEVPFMNYNSLARIVDKYRAPQPAPVMLTDEQIDAVLDSHGNIAYVIANKRERLRMFAREILRAAMLQAKPANTKGPDHAND
ncbi:hypothetical protein AC369_14375 [Salmonella enterica subsp. diarizonae]|nr:hypothetical protein [Salmonella enterica subsp. diarizonae]